MNDELPSLEPVRQLLLRAALDPAGAAQEFRTMAAKLIAAAERLEARAASGFKSEGGMGDRVRIQVVGPDGKVKSTHEKGDWS